MVAVVAPGAVAAAPDTCPRDSEWPAAASANGSNLSSVIGLSAAIASTAHPASSVLRPPPPFGPSAIADAAMANDAPIVNFASTIANNHSANRRLQWLDRSQTSPASVSGRKATAT